MLLLNNKTRKALGNSRGKIIQESGGQLENEGSGCTLRN